MLDAERAYYEQHNAAVHRGVHQLAEEATDAVRGRPATRSRAFIGAPSRDEVVFTKNATESLNLVAYAMSNAATWAGGRAVRARPWRRGRRHRDGAPRQPRAVAAAVRSAPARRCGGSALTDEGRLDLSNLDAA